MSHDGLAQRQRTFLVQRDRLVIAFLYGLGLLVIGYVAHGELPPPFEVEGLWFYGAFIPLLVARLIEPWFARPADALANGLAVLVATAALTPADTALAREHLDLGRAALAVYAMAVLVIAGIAVLGRNEGGVLGWVAPVAARIARAIGQAQVAFSLYLGFVALVGNADDASALALIAVAWVVVILLRPLEWLAIQLRALRPRLPHPVGVSIQEVIDPRLLLATVAEGTGVEVGTTVEWTSGARGYVVDRTELLSAPRLLIALEQPSRTVAGEGRLGDSTSSVIGYVADSSSIPELVARTSASAGMSGLAEGRLLSAAIRDRQTLFQVTSAAVDERVEWGIRRNLVSVKARKLGIWNDDERGFDQVPWLPDPGAAVSLVEEAKVDTDAVLGVGRLPGTAYHVGIKISQAVLYNTAILGILGVGKTSLAFELIQRMLCEGILVVVIDITGEYAVRFREIWPQAEETRITAAIEAELVKGRENQAPPKETAGNWKAVRPAIRGMLDDMVASDSRVLILNPSQIDATAEDGFPQSGVVPLRRLTNVEVVRLITEEVLEFARSTIPADPAAKLLPRICIVLEEAHSLVPEGGSTADRNEQTATAGTARAVLQGRKYGLGCLLITQRTANVTKTILNQCHTVFAMRSFDATSESFLANYLGRDYAGLLPSLRDRQAVIFGRGSTSEAPILIETNDRDRFAEAYGKDCAEQVPTTDLARRPSVPPNDEPTEGDDFEETPSVEEPPDWEELPDWEEPPTDR